MGWWTSDFWTMNTGWIIAILYTIHPMAWHLQEIQVGRVKSKSLRIHYVGTINLTQEFSLVMFCFFNSPRWDTHVVFFFDAKSQLFRNPKFRGILGNHICLPSSSWHNQEDWEDILVDKSRSLRQVESLQQVIKGLVSQYGGKPFTREFS